MSELRLSISFPATVTAYLCPTYGVLLVGDHAIYSFFCNRQEYYIYHQSPRYGGESCPEYIIICHRTGRFQRFERTCGSLQIFRKIRWKLLFPDHRIVWSKLPVPLPPEAVTEFYFIDFIKLVGSFVKSSSTSIGSRSILTFGATFWVFGYALWFWFPWFYAVTLFIVRVLNSLLERSVRSILDLFGLGDTLTAIDVLQILVCGREFSELVWLHRVWLYLYTLSHRREPGRRLASHSSLSILGHLRYLFVVLL